MRNKNENMKWTNEEIAFAIVKRGEGKTYKEISRLIFRNSDTLETGVVSNLNLDTLEIKITELRRVASLLIIGLRIEMKFSKVY